MSGDAADYEVPPLPPLERDRVAIELGLVPPYEGYQHPRWKRSRRGGTIHHYDCKRAATSALPWFWPEGEGIETDADLLLAIPPWLHPCKSCFHAEDIDLMELHRLLVEAGRQPTNTTSKDVS